MKRIVLLLATLLLLASCADFAVAQGPMTPQSGDAAAMVGSLKWPMYVWSGIDTLVGPTDSTALVTVYTGNALWNRWSMRSEVDSIGTDPDSVSFRWRYKLNDKSAWSALIVAGQITANGYPTNASGSISYTLVTTSLPEKPEQVQCWVVVYDAAGGDKVRVRRIELITQ